MSEERSNFEDWKSAVGPGWNVMVHPLLLLADRYGLSVSQVKEKFGGLRFYWGGVVKEKDENENDTALLTENYRKMVEGAESLSYHICEDCGLPGKNGYHGGWWIRTLCPICSAKLRSKSKEEEE